MKKKRIIILAIIIISVIAIILGIYSGRKNDGKGSRGDIPEDIKVEELEEELIIVPSAQDESEMQEEAKEQDKGQGKPNSKNETVESSTNQNTEQDVQKDSENGGIQTGPNELPFVPAE